MFRPAPPAPAPGRKGPKAGDPESHVAAEPAAHPVTAVPWDAWPRAVLFAAAGPRAAGCARRVELHAGDRRREGGWLGVVIGGQATVEMTGPDGRTMAMPAGVGAVFGVRSLLGEDRGSVLVAGAPVTLLEVGRTELRLLDPEVLRMLAAGPPRPTGAEGGPKQA